MNATLLTRVEGDAVFVDSFVLADAKEILSNFDIRIEQINAIHQITFQDKEIYTPEMGNRTTPFRFYVITLQTESKDLKISYIKTGAGFIFPAIQVDGEDTIIANAYEEQRKYFHKLPDEAKLIEYIRSIPYQE